MPKRKTNILICLFALNRSLLRSQMTDRKKQAHRINKAVGGQSIKRLVFLLVLVWTCPAFGATKYVATDGNDTAGDGSIGNPWLTIQYAFSQINSGDTIKVGAGTYHETANNLLDLNRNITATIESQSGNNDVWVKPNTTYYAIQVTAPGTITFNNINFMPIGATCYYLIEGGSVSNYDLTFNDCVMDMNSLDGKIFNTTSGTGENIRFNGCTITAADSLSMFCIDSVNIFEANNCDITTDGPSSLFFWYNNDCNTIEIKDCNINAGGSLIAIDIAYAGTDDSLDHLIITDNTVTGIGYFVYAIDEDVRFAKICNNTIVSSVGCGYGIINLGTISGTSFTNTLYGFVVKNNTITRSAANGNCLWLGANCYGAEVSHNFMTSVATNDNPHGIRLNGADYCNIHHNIIKSERPMYIHGNGGAYGNKIQYNTCYATSSYALSWEYEDGNSPSRNVITNNIFDASGSDGDGAYAIRSGYYSPFGHWDNYINYNCYVAGVDGLARLDNTVYNTMSEIRTKWAAWSDVWPENDAHSIIADPQFLDPTNGDFRLKPDSPCINAGEPTVGNGYTDIGAWQTIGRSELLPPNCTQLLEMDFNGDCKVDFYDFA